MSTWRYVGIAVTLLLVIGVGFYLSRAGFWDDSVSSTAFAAATNESVKSESSPVKAVKDRDVYYPGTENLNPDEMRIVACGTGGPIARPKQAAACFLVELGNGEKFLFDIGFESAERISAQKIPYDYLDKVFIGHLHGDHVGDLDALWIGGVTSNRVKPLRVWGPSGDSPEYGTKYFVETLQRAYKWDKGSRIGNIDTRGLEIEVHEFDYRGVNKPIYQENGVTITSVPAVHAIDGSVSFILTWNGLKFAFSSDTYPNKWFIKYAAGADLAIHECFASPLVMVGKQGWTPQEALTVATQLHTSPPLFGKVMSQVKPRMAVGYHFFNDFDTLPDVLKEVRKTYDGPLSLATDYMVWNVTKDRIRVRMSAIDQDIWAPPATTTKAAPDASKKINFSDFVKGGRVNYEGVIEKLYEAMNKKYGTDVKVPQ
jgi:ribonuclease Z